MMVPPGWKNFHRYRRKTLIDDLRTVAWALPMAFIIGYCLLVFMQGIVLTMENRERHGRYQGLHAISYTDGENE
jgi:hypothetical protein